MAARSGFLAVVAVLLMMALKLGRGRRFSREEGLKQVEVATADHRACLDVDEVLQIEHDINSQIYARDFLLIDQADMIVSFVPALPDGRAAMPSATVSSRRPASGDGSSQPATRPST